MSIKAVESLTAIEYVPRSELGQDHPTTFKLRPLDGLQYMEVMAEITPMRDGGYRVSGAGLRLAIKYGLAGWDNFTDADGKSIKFNPVNIGKVPPLVLSELAEEIMERSEMGEDAQKNS